ncbi:unnamed protein product [Ectocarpus sp. CCAP 1310/34]|nr:unnamed protein product [Ectocarpus sp. CCAP 1310/34]
MDVSRRRRPGGAVEKTTLCRDDEPRRIFLAAIKSQETHGAILLTGVDGADLIIHVNLSRFADLLKVKEAMEACPSVRPMLLTLTDQHKRFVKAGEVSKDYLKFLWLRDMELGQASQEAPRLEMSEADVEVMVDSFLDLRLVYRVRDGQHAFVPDRNVVASCLPNKAGPEVDPGNILELETASAIYLQKLKLVVAHAVPPGLVPRELAWCGRGEGRINACWKRGVCFAFKNHLMLLNEVRAGGNVFDESPRTALRPVVSSDGDHKALVERIGRPEGSGVKFMTDRSIRQDAAFLQWPIPRLLCLLPAPKSGAKPLEEKDGSFEEWSATLRKWCLGGKRKGKGVATRKLRLFFLRTTGASPSEGPQGKASRADVRSQVTELLKWAKKAKPFAKVGLALASIALRECTGLEYLRRSSRQPLGQQPAVPCPRSSRIH